MATFVPHYYHILDRKDSNGFSFAYLLSINAVATQKISVVLGWITVSGQTSSVGDSRWFGDWLVQLETHWLCTWLL